MKDIKLRPTANRLIFPCCSILLVQVLFLLNTVNAYTNDAFDFYTKESHHSQAVTLDFHDDAALQKQREKLIRKEILAMLGLHRAPKPLHDSKHNSAPKFMLELYKQLEMSDVGEGYSTPRDHDVISYNMTSQVLGNQAGDADMIVSFINHANNGMANDTTRDDLFSFESKEIPDIESVTLAEVRIFKNDVYALGDTDSLSVELDRVLGYRGDGSRITGQVTKATIKSDFHGWLDLNVTSVVADWLTLSTNDLQFLLTVRNNKGDVVAPYKAGITVQKGPEETKAFMVAFFKAVPMKTQLRQRRDVSGQTKDRESRPRKNRRRYDPLDQQTQRSRTEASCHRETFFVRFRDLQWEEWVIAPEGYAAFYCTGRCTFPLNARMNATNHAIVQTLVSLMRPRNVPLPCCAPTKLSPISVLYLDDESNVILRKFQNMVVTACGCH